MHPVLSQVLEGFERAIQNDSDVLGVLYTGSLGRGSADAFSDLDIAAWVTDSVLARASAKLDVLLGYCGTVHFAYRAAPHRTGFVGPDWRRVDLGLLGSEDLQPREDYAGGMVAKDTADTLAHLVAQSPLPNIRATQEQVAAAIAEAIDSQIYLALHNARGATWSAMGEISYRCTELYTLLARLRGRQSFGFRYVEALLSAEERSLLAAAWPKVAEAAEVRRAALALWRWTRYVWAEAELVTGYPAGIVIDEAELLTAVQRIYTWA
jgi:hypothetical protein